MDFAALQHSVFLQVLGSAILNSLWQAFVLWLLYKTISVSYNNASARFRNNLSTILLFFSFIWFISSFIAKIIKPQGEVSIGPLKTGISELTSAHPVASIGAFLSYAGSSLPYLSIAYIFLLFFLMAKLFTAYRYVYIISNKRLSSPPAQLYTFAKKVSTQMGITRKIIVWISHNIDVPATIGFIKPVILIPFASLNNLSADQLEAIILHELSHIKRNDYIINIVVSVIETILFFNPFVVLLSKVIKRERENCCDDFVLHYRYDPHSYATALLRLEQSRATTNLKLAIGAVSGKKQLLSRVKRITNGQVVSKQFNYGQKLLALLLVTGIICSVAWLSPGKKQASAKTFVKENKIRETLKTNLSPTPLHVTYDLKGNLQAKILKQLSPKKETATLQESAYPDLPVRENHKFHADEDIANGYNESTPLGMNINKAQFFFDESKLKLPPSINIKNFPFQSADFNLDLSMINMSKLNDNLKQAYKEIDNINWSKVEGDIRESLSTMKMTNFPSKEQVEFFIEKTKEFSKLKEDKQKLNKGLMEEGLNKEIQLHDSLHSKRMILIYENNARDQQREYRKIRDQYAAANISGNYNYAYSINNKSGKNTEDAPAIWVDGRNLSPLGIKNIKISVKHLPNCADLKTSKKLLQFSFKTDTKKTSNENVINVEVTD